MDDAVKKLRFGEIINVSLADDLRYEPPASPFGFTA